MIGAGATVSQSRRGCSRKQSVQAKYTLQSTEPKTKGFLVQDTDRHCYRRGKLPDFFMLQMWGGCRGCSCIKTAQTTRFKYITLQRRSNGAVFIDLKDASFWVLAYSQHVRKAPVKSCGSCRFYWACLLSHKRARLQRLTNRKFLTPVCQCSRAENPKRQAEGWTVSQWLSLVERLNECAGSAKVQDGQNTVYYTVWTAYPTPTQHVKQKTKGRSGKTQSQKYHQYDYAHPSRSLNELKVNSITFWSLQPFKCLCC